MVLTTRQVTKPPPHRIGRFISDGYGRFKCAHCPKHFTLDSFRNQISLLEAGYSRLCQRCQDKAYAD